jgi:hypothetical protein
MLDGKYKKALYIDYVQRKCLLYISIPFEIFIYNQLYLLSTHDKQSYELRMVY